MTYHRSYWMRLKGTSRALALVVTPLLLAHCADFAPFANVAELFQGNTRRDYQSYTLEDRVEYRKQRQQDRSYKRHEENTILENMNRSEIKSTSK